jgi:hypothetical protein
LQVGFFAAQAAQQSAALRSVENPVTAPAEIEQFGVVNSAHCCCCCERLWCGLELGGRSLVAAL